LARVIDREGHAEKVSGQCLQPTFCGTAAGQPVAIGAVASDIVAFQQEYQLDSPFDLNAPNPHYLGTSLKQGIGPFVGPYDPNYQTPRSVQMNVGVQRELRPGWILSADFVRNVQTHYFLGIDENHTGDIRYFDKTAALQAIAATNQAFHCGAGTDFTSIQCAIAAGAQMSDYATNGLTSSNDVGARQK